MTTKFKGFAWCQQCRAIVRTTTCLALCDSLRAGQVFKFSSSCHGEAVWIEITISNRVLVGIHDLIFPVKVMPPFHLFLRRDDGTTMIELDQIHRYLRDPVGFFDQAKRRPERPDTTPPMNCRCVLAVDPASDEGSSTVVEARPPLPQPSGLPKKPECFDCLKKDLEEFMTSSEGGYALCMQCFQYRMDMGRAKEAVHDAV